MEVFVKGWSGTTFPIQVSESHTIISVMHLIRNQTGIPLSEQRLVFAGKQLHVDHYRQLKDFGVKHLDTINLTGGLQAGGKRARSTQAIDEDKDAMTTTLRASITTQIGALDRGSSSAVRNFLDKVTTIDASMVAYNNMYFKEWLKTLSVKKLKRFQERLGENPSSKVDLRYIVIAKEIFEEVVAEAQLLTAQLQTVTNTMHEVARLVILCSYADENGLVSWKAMTKDVSDVLEMKCKEAGAAEALEQHTRAMDA
jgi:hypothetical protein